MTAFLLIYLLIGPAIVLAIWFWLRSRREPPKLAEPLDIGRMIGAWFDAFFALGWSMLLLATSLAGSCHVGFVFLTERVLLPAFRSGSITRGQWIADTYAVQFATRIVHDLFLIPATLMLIARAEGRPMSTGAAIVQLPRLFIPVILLGLLQLAGIAAGAIAFIVPGILLLLGWSVAPTVFMVEGTRMIAALRRSWDLAIGSRGRILIAIILFALIVIGASVPGYATGRYVPGSFWMTVVLGAAVSTVSLIMSAGFNAALYVELRRIREGLSAPGLAEVFA